MYIPYDLNDAYVMEKGLVAIKCCLDHQKAEDRHYQTYSRCKQFGSMRQGHIGIS